MSSLRWGGLDMKRLVVAPELKDCCELIRSGRKEDWLCSVVEQLWEGECDGNSG